MTLTHIAQVHKSKQNNIKREGGKCVKKAFDMTIEDNNGTM